MIQIGSTIGYYRAKEYREDRKSKPISIRGNWVEANLLRIDGLPGIDFTIAIDNPAYNHTILKIDEVSTGTVVWKVLIRFSSVLELYEKIKIELEKFEKWSIKSGKDFIAASIQEAGIINPEKVGKLIPLVKKEEA